MKLNDVIKEFVDVPNFPKSGIIFKDISKLFENPEAFCLVIDSFIKQIKKYNFDAILSLEARGWLFATTLAYKLNKPLVLIRKEGKLPSPDEKIISYNSEYAETKLQVAKDSLNNYQKFILIDDIIATGGSLVAIQNYLEQQNKELVKSFFVIDLINVPKVETIKNEFYHSLFNL
ncbi:hypothetical protein ASO20_00370 [Mycoplasma sp. (ex Biomphalaria glabrata)]|uniref:adenine phosphoribosyltransferase n=1 Tax=Mycoplasma sp. (ex Biomphalaria glabrata) TaxID=1749074 RepID=UPI00073A8AF6|nr:adenine phosphoribosyltransferase [Mycoplasma sp. (ex Biomphalaria glabrata)]ALV23136.1 hypothetical protein ASO20_00370 [Mycoplasma sp. (ex Biomphalaria glabrata)]